MPNRTRVKMERVITVPKMVRVIIYVLFRFPISSSPAWGDILNDFIDAYGLVVSILLNHCYIKPDGITDLLLKVVVCVNHTPNRRNLYRKLYFAMKPTPALSVVAQKPCVIACCSS